MTSLQSRDPKKHIYKRTYQGAKERVQGLVHTVLHISEIKLHFHYYLLLFTGYEVGPLYCYSISSDVQVQMLINNVIKGSILKLSDLYDYIFSRKISSFEKRTLFLDNFDLLPDSWSFLAWELGLTSLKNREHMVQITTYQRTVRCMRPVLILRRKASKKKRIVRPLLHGSPCSPSDGPVWPSFSSSIPGRLRPRRTWTHWRKLCLDGQISSPSAMSKGTTCFIINWVIYQ